MTGVSIFVIVAIAACCNLAFGADLIDPTDPCAVEKTSAQAIMEQFSGYKDEMPECLEEMGKEFAQYNWEGFDAIMESFERMFKRAEDDDAKKCFNEMSEMAQATAEKEKDAVIEAMKNFQVSQGCIDKGREAFENFMKAVGCGPPGK